MANATTATVEHGSGPAPEHQAEGGLLTPPFFIGLAMICVIAIIIWQKVPAAIGKALDSRIDSMAPAGPLLMLKNLLHGPLAGLARLGQGSG